MLRKLPSFNSTQSINVSQSAEIDDFLKPSFLQFFQRHSSIDVPPFKERLMTYTSCFVVVFSAFFIQAAMLFPDDVCNGFRLTLILGYLFFQVGLTWFAFQKDYYWAKLNTYMTVLMLAASSTVALLDRDFSAATSDSSLDFGQLPAYLPLLVLLPFTPLEVSVVPSHYLYSSSALLGVYFLPHLLTASQILPVFLETTCVGLFIFQTWRFIRAKHQLLLNTKKIIDAPEDSIEEEAGSLRTGLDFVLGGLKKARSNVELLMHTQSDDVKSFTRDLLRSLTDVTQKIAETDLYAADAVNLVEIDPEDRQFIQQNYMQSVNFSRDESVTPGLHTEVSENPKINDKYGYEKLVTVMAQMGKTWNFNPFMLTDLAESRPIPVVGKYFLHRFNLIERFSIGEDQYVNLFEGIESAYNHNPYHNSTHAVDVLHSFMYFALHSELSSHFASLEILGCLLACIAHDIGHPGLTNRFLMGARDDIALRYNDFSVLEMMHTALLFEMMKDDEMNIVKRIADADWVALRKQIIEMILATDMSRHFELLGRFRSISEQGLDSLSKFEVRLEVCKLSLKCADIAHAAKEVELHERWTLLICEEFFNQGDIERSKGMAISMYCDRHNTDIPKVTQK